MDRVGPTIIGRRNTPGADAARDLLTRNEVPHRWVDLDRDPLVPLLETELLSAGRLPLVVFPDGTQLEGPEDYSELVPGREEGVPRERYLASAHWRAEFAARAGLPTTPSNELYDAGGRWHATRSFSNRASPGSSSRATFATARSSESHRPSAKAQRRSRWCTTT